MTKKIKEGKWRPIIKKSSKVGKWCAFLATVWSFVLIPFTYSSYAAEFVALGIPGNPWVWYAGSTILFAIQWFIIGFIFAFLWNWLD